MISREVYEKNSVICPLVLIMPPSGDIILPSGEISSSRDTPAADRTNIILLCVYIGFFILSHFVKILLRLFSLRNRRDSLLYREEIYLNVYAIMKNLLFMVINKF